MAVAKRKSYKEKKEYIDNSKEKLEGFLAHKVDSIQGMLKSENPDVPVWNSPCFKIRYLNPVSGTVYNLENSMLLSILGKEKGFELPYYLTAKQGFDAGLSNKGDKPDQVFKAAADADRTANEIIYKLENDLKAKYDLDPTLPVSDFIKQRLSRADTDSTPQVKPPTIRSHDIQVETATPIQQQKKRTLKI